MNDSLEQLRDIHEPVEIGLFPFAPGWWVLLGLILIGLLVFYRLKKYRNNPRRKLKKAAFKELQRIKASYIYNKNTTLLIERISKMLRKITLSNVENTSNARLTGDEWLRYLDSISAYPIFSTGCGQIFSGDQYKKEITIDDSKLLDALEHWIEKIQ